MTEQNEDTPIMQATLKLPEGEVIITVPALLSEASAFKVLDWLETGPILDGVEINL